jgi:Kef-type K+ transport system membrane component KefB
MPLEPQLLEYEHTQFLVIGEARGGFGRALEEQSADKRDNTKEKPEEEMEKLEEEVSVFSTFLLTLFLFIVGCDTDLNFRTTTASSI